MEGVQTELGVYQSLRRVGEEEGEEEEAVATEESAEELEWPGS